MPLVLVHRLDTVSKLHFKEIYSYQTNMASEKKKLQSWPEYVLCDPMVFFFLWTVLRVSIAYHYWVVVFQPITAATRSLDSTPLLC